MKVQGFFKDIKGLVSGVIRRNKYLVRNKIYDNTDNVNYLSKRLHPGIKKLNVSKITLLREDFLKIRLSGEGLAPFRAGSYLVIHFLIDSVHTTRAYSITSSSNEALNENYYEIIIQKKPNGFVSEYIFNNLKEGDILDVDAPYGDLIYQPLRDKKNLVLIGGGSGITPFVSYVKTYKDNPDLYITIIYAARFEKDLVLLEELKTYTNKNIRIVPVISDEYVVGYESGFVTKDLIDTYCSKNSSFFICGNNSMVTFIRNELKELGITEKNIRSESLINYNDVKNTPGYISPEEETFNLTIKMGLNTKTVQINSNESVAVGLERCKEFINTKCRCGMCGACRVKLISGEVFSFRKEYVRKTDKVYGYIHSCSSYPLSNITIELPIGKNVENDEE